MFDNETKVHMGIREFEELVPDVLERMCAEGYSGATIGTAEWALGWFGDYCREEEVGDVDEAAVADFCAKRFGFVAGGPKLLPTQAAIRKPLLTVLELIEGFKIPSTSGGRI